MGRAEDLFGKLKKEGVQAIDDLIADRQSEEFFLDFKRSSDVGQGRTLSQNDRNNLSKAISGFANSEGGVIIWGVDCSPDKLGADVAKAKVPIIDAKAFKSRLDSAVSGCTVPPHQYVESISVSESAESGYAATLIPKFESAPLYSVQNQQFYIRAGSNFVPTPPGVLAGMFGRRPTPQPTLKHLVGGFQLDQQRVLAFTWKIYITHLGPGVIRDFYITVQPVVKNEKVKVHQIYWDESQWMSHKYSKNEISIVFKDGMKLGAFAIMRGLNIQLLIYNPPEDFSFELKYGCEGSQVYSEVFNWPKERVLSVYNKIIENSERSNFYNCLKELFHPIEISSALENQ